jgi:hypothetical protein
MGLAAWICQVTAPAAKRDEGEVMGRSRVYSWVAVEHGASHRHTERGTGHCMGNGGNKVKVRVRVKRRVPFRKDILAIRSRCKEGIFMQRSCTLVLHARSNLNVATLVP